MAPPKPADDPTAKVVDTKEIKAAIDTPPPLPEPKPQPKPAPVEKVEKKVEPKRDLIAEALKKEDAKKKPEPKKEAKAPTPPTPPKKEAQQPKFDPEEVEALLDKRAPQRLAAAGDTLNRHQFRSARRAGSPRNCRRASSMRCARGLRNCGARRPAPRIPRNWSS